MSEIKQGSAQTARERLLNLKAGDLPKTHAGDEPPKDLTEVFEPAFSGKPIKEPEVASSVEATLAQRGSRYGDFTDHAAVCQEFKDLATSCTTWNPELPNERIHGWQRLDSVKRQAIEVIFDKIARILTGDPNYDDNWHDIQGYAKLVEDRLPCNQQKEDPVQHIGV